MADNLYQAYVVGRYRRADALRDAEQHRLAKSLEEARNRERWLQRLILRHIKAARVRQEGRPTEALRSRRRPARSATQ